jgi:hypothetical protein
VATLYVFENFCERLLLPDGLVIIAGIIRIARIAHADDAG